MKTRLKSAVACMAVAAMASMATNSAQAIPVGLEMVLMMDVSGSISNADFGTQRDGYRDAFLDTTVQGYIAATPGGVAVSLVQWSTGQNLTVGWTLLKNAADAITFSGLIGAMPRISNNATGTRDALNYSAALLAANNYEGERSVIDVSSDGFDNTASGCLDFNQTCVALQVARNAFLAADDDNVINALWIADENNYTAAQLLSYGTANLVGGSGSFQLAVVGSSSFDDAIREKLRRELQIPEPGSVALAGLALLGLAASRRRRA